MLGWIGDRLSYANVMATVAAVGVLAGGTAWALQTNSVKSKHIKNNQVKFADLRGVKAWNKRGPVTGSAPDPGDARAEADPVVLAKRGTITIYGKCYRNEAVDAVFAGVFVRTTRDGAAYRADNGSLRRLDKSTPEQNRNLTGSAGAFAGLVGTWDEDFDRSTIIAAGHKLALNTVNHPIAKNDTPSIGDAPFGSGDRCSFTGFVIG